MFKHNVISLLLAGSIFCGRVSADIIPVTQQANVAQPVEEVVVSTEAHFVVSQQVRDICDRFTAFAINEVRCNLDEACSSDGTFSYKTYIKVRLRRNSAVRQNIIDVFYKDFSALSKKEKKLIEWYFHFMEDEVESFTQNKTDFIIQFMEVETYVEAKALNKDLEEFIATLPKRFFGASPKEIQRESVLNSFSFEKLQLLPEPESGRSIEEIRKIVSSLLDEAVAIYESCMMETFKSCVDQDGVFNNSQQIQMMRKSLDARLDARLAEFAPQGLIKMYIEEFYQFCEKEALTLREQKHSDLSLAFAEEKTLEEALKQISNVMTNTKAVFLEQNFPVTVQA